MKKLNWKTELMQALLAIMIITVAEVLLQKGPYDFIEVLLSVVWKILLIFFIRSIFIHFKT